MIRGTTPIHIFSVPVDPLLIDKLRIIYAQGNEAKIIRTLESCAIDGDKVSVQLTQEETLSLNSSQCVQIQMRILTTGGDALASEIKMYLIGELLEDEVI